MRKKGLFAAMLMIAVTITACGGKNDSAQKESNTTNLEATQPNINNADNQADNQTEKDNNKEEYVMYCKGEKIETSLFDHGPIEYYGPSTGDTLDEGNKEYSLSSNNELQQRLFVLDSPYNYSSIEPIRNMKLEEQEDYWMECFNKELGLEFGVCLTGVYESTYGKDAWRWEDKQVWETVTINGRECIKFSGIVGVESKREWKGEEIIDNATTYVTGYYFNVKYKAKDGSEEYTSPMAIMG